MVSTRKEVLYDRWSFMTGGLYRQEVLYDRWYLQAGGPL